MRVRLTPRRTAALLRRQIAGATIVALSTVSAVVSAVYLPAPWEEVEIGIAAVIVLLALRRMTLDDRRDLEHAYLMSRTPEAQLQLLAMTQVDGTYRDWLLREHFAVTPETYTVACNYCDWKTTDYARRLVDAPRHLHDVHPKHDPRIHPWLRRRLTTWIGRRVTPA
ncbi:MAG: hypothetical protein ACRDLE_02635 [Gaiellaceae bacterium]